ncbi:hypothetical protein Slin15195_G046370 [Septoria linicola]|uniref:CID domain-containing protein n=1 Tax=Septoria linicola TaxID=215465 RepID=A0A9Q9EJG7_9PEZI|nr:hypothetical protein Slin15195_G046370 [Septoria linicola]
MKQSNMERIAASIGQPRPGRAIGSAFPRHVNLRLVNSARDVFGAMLIRSGLHRTEADAIAAQICKTCNECTVENVQLCKAQFTQYILPSQEQHVAYCFYLESLCRTFAPGALTVKVHPGLDECFGLVTGNAAPVSYLRRVYVLYILHDILISLWTKHSKLRTGQIEPETLARSKTEGKHAEAAEETLKKCFFKIFELAAYNSAAEPGSPKHHLSQLLVALRRSWLGKEEQQLVALQKLCENSDNQRNWPNTELDLVEEYFGAAVKQIPRPLGAKHGVKDDPNAPWHLLPAANGLKMREERGFPLLARAFPRGGYNLVNGGKLPSDDVRKEATGLLNEMRHCFDPFTRAEEVQDIDPLGNKVWKDPERATRNYWGFSDEGLQQMKENKRKFGDSARGYGDIPPPERPKYVRNNEVERARELAASRGRGGRGGYRGGRGYRGRGGY